MEKILTAKQKWAYAHWYVKPEILWIGSPLCWIVTLLSFFNGYVWFETFFPYLKIMVLSPGWYYRAASFLSILLFVSACVVVSYLGVYFCARLYVFLFNKNEFFQKYYKYLHICKNPGCYRCYKEDCNARL